MEYIKMMDADRQNIVLQKLSNKFKMDFSHFKSNQPSYRMVEDKLRMYLYLPDPHKKETKFTLADHVEGEILDEV